MMNTNNKFSSFTVIRDVFFSGVGIGISANIILLLSHTLIFLLQHRVKPTDLTISHLALVHTIMLFTVSFVATDMFGSSNVWDDFICKSVVCMYRLMRSLSICTTCVLSVTQAITLSPRNSCLAKFKQKFSHYNLSCFSFLWFFNMLTSARCLVSTAATRNVTLAGHLFVTESCSFSPMSYFYGYVFYTLVAFRDVFFIGLMTLSSGYMVTLLCRHKRQTQHLHKTNLSPRAAPEERATKVILWLMTFFVTTYFLDSAVSFTFGSIDSVFLCFHMLVANSYAIISPLVLISTEKQIIKALTLYVGEAQKMFIQ